MSHEDQDPKPLDHMVDDFDPRQVERTGDDSPADSVWRYVRRMSGWHQLPACTLAVIVALLNLAPVELQRRIVDDALMPKDYDMLVMLGVAYAVVLLAHQLLKLALRLYQSWISESAIIYTRRHLLGLYNDRLERGPEPKTGRAVAVMTAETDKLGGFVGEGLVQAASNTAMLIGAIGYMVIVDWRIALFGLAFMLPQILLTPFMQNRLNQLVEQRVGHMRDLGDGVAVASGTVKEDGEGILSRIYQNRMRFFLVKFSMKALLNLLNAAAPLTVLIYGGYLVLQGETTVGVIVAFLAGFQHVSAPLRELIAFYRVAEQARVQHEMIAGWMTEGKQLPGAAKSPPDRR